MQGIAYTPQALQALREAPPHVKKAFYKQVRFLIQNLQHPGLQAKKYGGQDGNWQARVNLNWRFYFTIAGTNYVVYKICPHPKK